MNLSEKFFFFFFINFFFFFFYLQNFFLDNSVKAPPYNEPFSPFSFIAIADYGVDNSENNTKLLNEMAQNDQFSFVIHPGDISYANDHPLVKKKKSKKIK